MSARAAGTERRDVSGDLSRDEGTRLRPMDPPAGDPPGMLTGGYPRKDAVGEELRRPLVDLPTVARAGLYRKNGRSG